MANIKNPYRIWNHLPDVGTLTPPDVYFNRRDFIKKVGAGSIALTGFAGMGASSLFAQQVRVDKKDLRVIEHPGLDRKNVLDKFPVPQNKNFVKIPGELTAITPKQDAMSYNNFYEYTLDKAKVWKVCQDFVPDPWKIEITGECRKPKTLDIDDIYKFPMEQRNYRFRCVEAWAMNVPWDGVPFHRILESVEPTSNAKYVKFTCVERPKQMPGQVSMPWYPWPYFEAWRMDEAMNELVLLVTGMYGQPIPIQNGSPFRMIIPWKYGYKGPKCMVKIELTKKRPPTFWHTEVPDEYSWLSNIDPNVPHPRWSQATESVLGTGKRRPTLMYGGYGEYVAKLYQKPDQS
ncbi:protein-methionine-sulfoxide reductase catalytic subunit MsrP [Poriferisphaera sp. WC338]|uniref:protein-methionine-sulfoxide reductase catalytic subunit MsrP n=1 Tax=Poriferisphaera sp. WC338 TaxID=3425129 RepID=UPI003D8156DE